MSVVFEFKTERTFEQRQNDANKIKEKYPERIPVICERAKKSQLPDLDKKKYLVPDDLTVSQFIYIIRKRIRLPKEKSLMIFVNGKELLRGEALMSEVYSRHKDEDGFLYVLYAELNVLGQDLSFE